MARKRQVSKRRQVYGGRYTPPKVMELLDRNRPRPEVGIYDRETGQEAIYDLETGEELRRE
jgi:hypothetical protein